MEQGFTDARAAFDERWVVRRDRAPARGARRGARERLLIDGVWDLGLPSAAPEDMTRRGFAISDAIAIHAADACAILGRGIYERQRDHLL